MFSSLQCWGAERHQRTRWEMGRPRQRGRILAFPWEPVTAGTGATLQAGQGLRGKTLNCVSNRPGPRIQMSGQMPISVSQGRYFLDEINF